MDVFGQITGSLNVFVEGAPRGAVHVYPTGFIKANGNVRIADFGNNQVVPPIVDPGGFYSVGPFVAFDAVSSGVDGMGNEARTAPPIQTARRTITADGTIVVAQGHDLKGRLVLNWPNYNNRSASMVMGVACTVYALNCTLNIPVNWAYQQYYPGFGDVFLNPTIRFYRDSNKIMWPQIQVDVVNRNSRTPTLVATWYGTPGEQIALLPTNLPLGTEAPPA
jgi:hypothetical protein